MPAGSKISHYSMFIRSGLFLAACSLVGCQEVASNVAPVNGVVLLYGMPARASITSQLVDATGRANGRPSTGETRSDGTFSLLYSEAQPGALVGPQQVTITIFPYERAEGEFDFNQRFKPVKVVKFNRIVEANENTWRFQLTL